MDTQLTDLPPGLLAALGVLSLAQLTLLVVALVDLYRRPADRVAGGNKWIWLVVVLFVNLLGAVLYLAVGRKAAPAQEVPPAPRGGGSVADALYGRPTDDPPTDR